MTEEKKTAAMPASPSSTDNNDSSSGWKPYEVDPDLANIKMAGDMMAKMGDPGIVSKLFVVWQGLYDGVNNSATNKTYYDASMRASVYKSVFKNSVNVEGALFHAFWTYMNKPKMIVQGIPGQQTFEEEKKESLIDKGMRLFGFRGGDKNDGKQSS